MIPSFIDIICFSDKDCVGVAKKSTNSILMVVYLPSLSVLNLIYIFNNCCMSTGQVVRFPDPVGIFNANPAYRTPRKDSNWELIALLTSPLTCYRLVTEKWVLLLSMVFGPERDARFFFIVSIFSSSCRTAYNPFLQLTSTARIQHTTPRCQPECEIFKEYRRIFFNGYTGKKSAGKDSKGYTILHSAD